MKKLYLLMILLLLASPLLMAARGGGGTTIKGDVTNIDPGAATITIQAEYPGRYAGNYIVVQVTPTTIVKECVDGVSHRISFDEVEVGWYAKANGTFDGAVLIATNIIVYPEGQP